MKNRTEYLRNWRKINPDKVNKYHKKNRDYFRAWYKENAEYRRDYMQKWLEANPDYKREWRETYRDKQREYSILQDKRLKLATPNWINKNALLNVYRNCPIGYVVDHIVPIKGKTPDSKIHNVCGLHVPWNLQYLTANANSKKNNQMTKQDLATACRVEQG